ncbi:MAG: zinc dependent phospholipase C family protein, partial [Myxococcota bacterium]|nr:zinc dependent phospholipase C family protein [Myxococcota bacterium]
MKLSRPARCSLVGLLLLAFPGSAAANGQSTHVWITEQALQHLDEGELATLLRDPANRDPLLNGTMFPDGGYAVVDPYGELAHWEPFQQAYLRWIRLNFDPPWSEGEAAAHVAFFMGLASHGLADEVFDSLFMERSRIYDPGWETGESSLDTASDVLFLAEVGGIEPPDLWLPMEVVLPIFHDELGHPVEAETIERGQNLLFSALAFTEWARQDEERLKAFSGEYPWSKDNLGRLEVPGSPPREALVVALYWEDLWARLHEPETWTTPVLELVPEPDSQQQHLDAETVEARLHLTFGRGVDAASLTNIEVLDEAETPVPVDVHHHYGNFSHAVHLVPESDWAVEARYQVVVGAGLLNYDGVPFEGSWTGEFSTSVPPAPED